MSSEKKKRSRSFYVILPGAFIFSFLSWLANYRAPQFLFGRAIYYVKTDQKVVALTFDDGPRPPVTNQILEILKQHQVHATFFVLGQNAKRYPDLIKEIYGAGHDIGNHSWSHPFFVFKTPSFVKKEIEDTDTLLRKLGYDREIHFRAPYSLKFYTLSQILASLNKKHIIFDVMPADWKNPGADVIAQRVVEQVKPGSIILLHDGGGKSRTQTIQATKLIIKNLTALGYRFLTISELLKYQ